MHTLLFNTNYLKTALFTKYGYLPPIHSAPEVRSRKWCIFKEEAADAQELISRHKRVLAFRSSAIHDHVQYRK